MIKVSGGSGSGTFRVETENGDAIDVSEALNAYGAAHVLAPFFQQAIDLAYATGAKDALDRVDHEKPARKSSAPKGAA